MKSLILPGCWYCDSLPNGRYVASVFNKDKNITNDGEANGQQLIWTVIGSNNRFAGSGHINNHAWEYDNEWNDKGVSEGLHSVIYKEDGTLEIVRETEDAPTGALGYRYLDDNGNLIKTIDTYSPEQALGKQYNIQNLWEFTIRSNGDIIVGQAEDGVGARIFGKYIKIHTLVNSDSIQDARYVNFKMENNNVAISWYFFRSSTDYTACFLWCTVDELRKIADEQTEPVPTPEGDVMIPAFERPMWMAPYFSHHIRYGDTSKESHVGNTIAVLGDERDQTVRNSELERIKQLGMPMIVDIGTHEPPMHSNIIAWLAAAGSMQELEAVVFQAWNYTELPIIAYLDGRSWPDNKPDWIVDRVWPSIQAYRLPNESLNDFINKMNEVIERVSKYNVPLSLVPRFDDFNGSSTIEKTLECMPFYEELLRNYNFVVHMPFADRRGNGISRNQSLWNWARTFQYAIPSERPNRFDYWRPENSSIEDILENKLGQSRAAVVLEPYLREYILGTFDDEENNNNEEEPEIDINLLREVLEASWTKYGGGPGGGNPIRGSILNEAAYNYNQKINAEHVGLSRKESGSFVTQPHTNEKIAHDIIQAKPAAGAIFSTMYDVFSDTGVSIGEAEPHNDENRIWIPAVKP